MKKAGGGKIVPRNFLLWIDAVGGFWVCTGDKVAIGQPGEGKDDSPDLPILGDISHRHARIRRDGENYLIEAIREVRLDGRQVVPLAALTDGGKIELGSSVRLKFRRPHALTGTARLEFASNHRTQPTVNAVILMSDTCILGPRPHSHILCRNWTEEVILFKHENELYCRCRPIVGQIGNLSNETANAAHKRQIEKPSSLQIDGVKIRERGRLQYDSRVVGEGFSFNLEPL
jgi:hypothetical protein